MAELLEKMPPEKGWKITAKFLIGFSILRGSKTVVTLLGQEEGIVAPIWGLEKFEEILLNVFSDLGNRIALFIKKAVNISVEDAVGAAKLITASDQLMSGPEWEYENIEETPERVVYRKTKCPWWERYKELKIDPERRPCEVAHQALWEEGLKTINPKLTFKLTKAMPRGDTYCELVFEFKEEENDTKQLSPDLETYIP